MRAAPVFLLFAPSLLVAQQDSAAARDTARLAPTIVTVTRVPMSSARVPYAVSVNTRDEIQRGKPGLALDEALTGIPGVQVDNRFNYALGERISIRGIGARAQFGVRGVRVLLDGIPMTLADGQTTLNNIDVASLARAEVLRGAASALHGNSAGGVIQLGSDIPDPVSGARAGLGVRTDFGEHGLVRTGFDVGARAGSMAIGASASRLRFDGYRNWNDARNDHLALNARSALTRDTFALLFNWVDYAAKNPGSLDTMRLRQDRRQAFANNVNFQTGERGKQGQIGATWNRTFFGAGLGVALHGLQRRIENPIPQRIVAIDRDAGGARISLGGAPRLGDVALNVTAGAELQLQRDDRRNFINTAGARGADTLDQRERVENSAIFTQLTVSPVEQLLVMIGGRVDRIRFRVDDRLVGAGNPDDSGERTMSAASPSVGATWSPLRLLDVYANYSTAFETPTSSELANRESGAGGLNPSLDPQRTRSGELGIKGRLVLPGVVGSYQLAGYEMRVRDALIPFEVASLPGRQYFRNAGSTENRGLEFATTLFLPWRLSLRASATHTSARFDEYSVTTSSGTTVYDGNLVPGVARNRADATVTYGASRWFVDAEVRASSSITVNDANTARSPGYETLNVRAGLTRLAIGRAAAIRPHVGLLNVFDRRYNTSVVVNAFGGRFFEPGPPRSVYGGLRLDF